MKWPFARHAHSPEASHGGAGPITIAEPARPEVHAAAADAGPKRRDWATLPPLKVAGGRPINLTAATRAFTQSLASKQVLVHSPRLELVRQIDAPSGSFRGILAPAINDHESGPAPDLQEASPLPPIEHRHVAAVTGDHHGSHGLSAVDQLLAIGDGGGPSAGRPAMQTLHVPSDTHDVEGDGGSHPSDRPGDSGGPRAGLADSRRRGLGPAYHGPLPEAMRAERERHDGPGGGIGASTEVVPADLRATMRDVLGMDVGDRLVHRGPAVSAEAEAMGAQAFTRDGQIYVHDDVGPFDQARGRATLAHELTHAAQQIVHGTLHDEATAAGQALEAHAQRVEQFVRGDGGAIKPTPDLLHARPAARTAANEQHETDVVSSAQQMMREMVDSGLARADGTGGIVFTMPPSSMTASAGTQRLAGDAPTAHAGSPTHWNPVASFGSTVGQGLANDMLGIAGSVFGFSDEFVGEQRQGVDRQFRREETTRRYSDLRLEHLRRVELTNLNDTQARYDLERSSELDAETLRAIDRRVDEEVTERLALLDEQAALALQQINEQRETRNEAALPDVPEANFNTALTALFENAEDPALPTEEELLATLTAASTAPGSGGAPRPGGGTTTRPSGGPPGGTAGAHSTGTRASSLTGPTGGAHPTGPGPGSPTGHGGTGTEAADTEQPWRTDATMGGRFQALGTALAGDLIHDELETFGSLLGFDSEFEQSLHDEVTPSAAAAGPAAPATATAAGDAHPGAASSTVDNIVADPYALDELATRLYPTIRSRLRQELLIDRERAGLLADFR